MTIKTPNNLRLIVEWPPEIDINLNKLNHRAIQIDIRVELVKKHIQDYILDINDVTPHAKPIKTLANSRINKALSRLPKENVYMVGW